MSRQHSSATWVGRSKALVVSSALGLQQSHRLQHGRALPDTARVHCTGDFKSKFGHCTFTLALPSFPRPHTQCGPRTAQVVTQSPCICFGEVRVTAQSKIDYQHHSRQVCSRKPSPKVLLRLKKHRRQLEPEPARPGPALRDSAEIQPSLKFKKPGNKGRAKWMERTSEPVWALENMGQSTDVPNLSSCSLPCPMRPR